MSRQAVLLCSTEPQAAAVVAAARSVLPGLDPVIVADGAALQLLEGGAALLTFVRPRLIEVPGELPRLLDEPEPEPGDPVWWTDVALGFHPRVGQLLAAVADALDCRLVDLARD